MRKLKALWYICLLSVLRIDIIKPFLCMLEISFYTLCYNEYFNRTQTLNSQGFLQWYYGHQTHLYHHGNTYGKTHTGHTIYNTCNQQETYPSKWGGNIHFMILCVYLAVYVSGFAQSCHIKLYAVLWHVQRIVTSPCQSPIAIIILHVPKAGRETPHYG